LELDLIGPSPSQFSSKQLGASFEIHSLRAQKPTLLPISNVLNSALQMQTMVEIEMIENLHSGYIFQLAMNTICWPSQKQSKTVSLSTSTVEAEDLVLSYTAKQQQLPMASICSEYELGFSIIPSAFSTHNEVKVLLIWFIIQE